MSIFNIWGLVVVVLIMIPNIVWATKQKGKFESHYQNKTVETLEQIGRFGCFATMIVNIPYTFTGFYLTFGKEIYLGVNAVMVTSYLLGWVLCKQEGITKALVLSVVPSTMFLFSGIMIGSILLTTFAVIFCITHVLISYKNGNFADQRPNKRRRTAITAVALALSFVLVAIATVGALVGYGAYSYAKINKMTTDEMLRYNAQNDVVISVAILSGDKTTFKVYENGILSNEFVAGNKPQNLFDYEIGSVSKTFAGLLFAKAFDEGKSSPDDGIDKFLTLPEADYYPTIRRLLTHTSGYEGYYLEPQMVGNKLARNPNDFFGVSREQILQKVASTKLQNKDYPFCYSNFGIAVLGQVLEKIYNKDYTSLVNEFVQNQLGLANTSVATQSGNLDGYWQWAKNDGYIPAGAIISNIADMAKYVSLYFENSSTYYQKAIVPLATINANTDNNIRFGIRMDKAACCWIIDSQNDFVWHNGATSNFSSYIAMNTKKQTAVILLGNISATDKIPLTVVGAQMMAALLAE